MWWPRKEYPRAGQKALKTCGSKERMTMSSRVVALKEKFLQMEVVVDMEPRPHKAVSFVVRREEEVKEWNEQQLPEVLLGYSGGRFPGRSTKKIGSEEGEVDEDGGKRRIRGQIVQEVILQASRRR